MTDPMEIAEAAAERALDLSRDLGRIHPGWRYMPEEMKREAEIEIARHIAGALLGQKVEPKP